TLSTKYVGSISLCAVSEARVKPCQGIVPWVDFLASLHVGDHEADARRRRNGSAILLVESQCPRQHPRRSRNGHTLSPNPHIRARTGCCATNRLNFFPSRTASTGRRTLRFCCAACIGGY